MFARFMNLLKAKANKEMSELETPEVLAEQAQMEIEANIKDLRDALVASMTNQKSLEQQIKKNREEVATWEKRAAVAVQQNNDEVARQCLQKKQELNQNFATLTTQLETQTKATADLKAKSAECEEQLRGFQQKKASFIARAKAGDSTAKANELMSGTGGSGIGKWEQKIQEKEFKAEADRQMSGKPIDDKFAELDQKNQLDDELATLKEKMGTPKLIVDTEAPGTPVADDNVPMVAEDQKDKDKP
jgi:phage shock protein A